MTRTYVWAGLASAALVTAWLGCSEDDGEEGTGTGGSGGTTTGSTTTTVTGTATGTSSGTATGSGMGDVDYVEVTIDGDQVFLEDRNSPLCGAAAYAEQVIDITNYADGNAHTIAFHAETFSSYGGFTNIFIDSVSLADCSGGTGGAGGMGGAGGSGGAGGAGGGGGSCNEMIADGSFEAGPEGAIWEEDSLNFASMICNADCTNDQTNFAHQGDWWLWLGGVSSMEENATVSQSVVIPATATELRFQLWLFVCDGR